jgi:hypothetical protein
MRRFFALSLSCASLLAALAVMATVADAQHARQPARHHARVRIAHYPAPPLTVRRRSFLDPGNVVPVGSLSNYMIDNTIFIRTPDQNFARSKFGNETLPGPFDLPGRQEPIFEFSTGGY